MRLKKIENAIVHCKTQEEAEALINGLEVKNHIKYHWIDYWENYGSSTCYRIENGKVLSYCDIHFYEIRDYEITEFCDLIEPEEQMLTAEEVIEFLVKHYYDGEYIKAFGENYRMDQLLNEMSAEEVVSKISKWKSEHEKHEKKEPEIEWVYRVFGAENYGEKFFQTEEEAIKRCEELAKSQKTKQYARYERVCRVKAVE